MHLDLMAILAGSPLYISPSELDEMLVDDLFYWLDVALHRRSLEQSK
jgi:hypothetical protein